MPPRIRSIDVPYAPTLTPTTTLWVVPTVHPAFLLRGGGHLIRAVAVDLARAMRVAVHGEPSWDPGQLLGAEPLGVGKIGRWIEETIEAGCRVAVDVENSLEYRGIAVLTHIGIARGYDGDHRAPDRSSICISLIDRTTGRRIYTTPGEARIKRGVKELLRSRSIVKVMQNGPHDVDVLIGNGYGPIRGYSFDTLVAHQALWCEEPHDLGYLGSRYLDIDRWKEEVKGGGGTMYRVPEPVFRIYNATDAAGTLAIVPHLEAELETAGPSVKGLFERKMAVSHLARRIGARGLFVDQDRLEEVRSNYMGRIEVCLKVLRRISGNPSFDPNKTRDLRYVIYRRFKAPVTARTPKLREPTLKADLLPRLRPYVPPDGKEFIDQYLIWKSSTKIESTYLRSGWRDNGGGLHGIEIINGVVHSLLSVTTAVTDRWSSSSPNIQNLPRGDPDDPESDVRAIYVARPRMKIY